MPDIETVAPLTSLQQGILFESISTRTLGLYTLQTTLEIKGKIDPDALQRTFNALISRHPALRAVFIFRREKKPVQVFLKQWSNILTVYNLGEDADLAKLRLKEITNAEFRKHIDLSRGPLFRAALMLGGGADPTLSITSHHLIMDGWSLGILIKELLELYSKVVANKAIEYTPCQAFAAFCKLPRYDRGAAAELFWKDYLSALRDAMPVRIPCSENDKENSECSRALPPLYLDGLAKVASEQRISLNSMFLTALGIACAHLFGRKDVLFNVVISRRPPEVDGSDRAVGLFITTLPIMISVTGDVHIDIARRVHADMLAIQEWSHLSTSEVLTASGITKDHLIGTYAFESYYVDSILYSEEALLKHYGLAFSKISSRETHIGGFNVIVTPGKAPRVTINYPGGEANDPLAEGILDGIIGSLGNLQCAEGAGLITGPCPVALAVGADSSCPRTTLSRLFNDAVSLHHDNKAIIFSGRSISYAHLRGLESAFARQLVRCGVAREHIVAAVLPKSLEHVVAMLGTFRSGSTWLPIDPLLPDDRLVMVLGDAHPRVIVVANEESKIRIARLVSTTVEICCVPALEADCACDASIASDQSTSSDVAYIIYTSGSTGVPKGVAVSQEAVINTILWRISSYGLMPGQVTMQMTSPSFDVSFQEILGALFSGGCIVIPPDHNNTDLLLVCQLISECKVSYLTLTPSVYNVLLKMPEFSCEAMKWVTLGGEKISKTLIDRHLNKFSGVMLFNEYGLTEASICSACTCLIPESSVNIIGRPIYNTKLAVIDPDTRRFATFGEMGEIAIFGSGLSEGYINSAELTASRLIPAPQSNERMLCTGDMGIMDDTGVIQLIGRADNLIKWNGHRIELEDIEAAIMRTGMVTTAVVHLPESNGASGLHAFVYSENYVDIEKLMLALRTQLPSYMWPSKVEVVEAMPLTINGKVDRAALKERQRVSHSKVVRRAHGDEHENMVANLWRQIFQAEPDWDVGFVQAGGDSLRALELMAAFRRELKLELRADILYGAPSLSFLIDSIRGGALRRSAKINTGLDHSSWYLVTPGQKKLYLQQLLHPRSTAFNMTRVFEIPVGYDYDQLRRILKRVFASYDSMRLEFRMRDSEVEMRSGSVCPDFGAAILLDRPLEKVISDFVQPFDLGKGPLVRTNTYVRSDGSGYLLLDVHHIICDGISLSVIERDVRAELSNGIPGGGRTSYADYARWLTDPDGLQFVEEQASYASILAQGGFSWFRFDAVREQPAINGGQLMVRAFDDGLSGITMLCAKGNQTPFTVALTLLSIALRKLSGQRKFLISTYLAGRGVEGIDDTIGLFANKLPIACEINDGEMMIQACSRIGSELANAILHQHCPPDAIDAALRRIVSSPNNLDIICSWVDEAIIENKILKEYEVGLPPQRAADQELYVTFRKKGRKMSVVCEYKLSSVSAKFVENLLNGLHAILMQCISNHGEVPIRALEIIDAKTQQELLLLGTGPSTLDMPGLITQKIDQVAERYPEKVAVTCDGDRLSYKELVAWSCSIAEELESMHKVSSGDIVGVCGRSLASLPTMLGILRLGAVYFPIDIDGPNRRVTAIINDARAKVIVAVSEIKYAGAVQYMSRPRLDSITVRPAAKVHLCDPAYIMYTSGSTGSPKGVVITHGAIANFGVAIQDVLALGPTKSFLASTSATFDVSLLETLVPLSAGASVIYATEEIRTIPSEIAAVISRGDVDICQFTPSFMRALLAEPTSHTVLQKVETIVLGGEALTDALVSETRRFFDGRLINMYGPTETTVYSSCKEMGGSEVTCGRPINNTCFDILNEDGTMAPPGHIGFLHISGVCVAAGYLNLPDKTRHCFTSNPYRPSLIMYETGDLATWKESGDVKIFGRVDDQLKINGQRVELAEIESALASHPGIESVAVVAVQEGGRTNLRAFYTGHPHTLAELRPFLFDRVPGHMIPSDYVHLASLPLTASNKVDRHALMALPITASHTNSSAVEEVSGITKMITLIWQDILSRKMVGLDENLFEIGGTSIDVLRIQGSIRQKLSVEVSAGDLITCGSIRRIAMYIERIRQPESIISEAEDIHKRDRVRKLRQLKHGRDTGQAL